MSLQFFKFDFLKTVRSPEHRKAWFVAIIADTIQIVGMPLFAVGALSPADTVLDWRRRHPLQHPRLALGLSAHAGRGACPWPGPLPHLDGRSLLRNAVTSAKRNTGRNAIKRTGDT